METSFLNKYKNGRYFKIILKNVDFEIEERKMALREREFQIQNQEAMARKALAEAEALELTNMERRKALGLL